MREPSRLLVVLPLAFVATLASACVQALGIKDVPGTCGELSYASTDCAACMTEGCCSEIEACKADPGCATKLACVSACAPDDASCRLACGAPVEGPGTPAADVAACRGHTCASACVRCAGYSDKFGAACATCARKASLAGSTPTCCDLEEACAALPSCDKTARCLLRCQDPDCLAACSGAASVEDQSRIDEIVRCANLCGDCGFGQDFACVGDFKRPQPNQSKARLRSLVTDIDYKPLSGAIDVRACSVTDFACSRESAVEHADANAEGVAILEVPLNATNGFQGFLLATDPSGGLLPSIVNINGLLFDATIRMPLYGLALVQNGATLVGDSFDPKRDVLLVLTASDCRNGAAPGVVFVIAPPFEKTRIYYLDSVSGLPDPKAVATPPSGLAFALVHPSPGAVPGYLSLEGRRSGSVIGRTIVPLRAGTVTTTGYRLVPAPGG